MYCHYRKFYLCVEIGYCFLTIGLRTQLRKLSNWKIFFSKWIWLWKITMENRIQTIGSRNWRFDSNYKLLIVGFCLTLFIFTCQVGLIISSHLQEGAMNYHNLKANVDSSTAYSEQDIKELKDEMQRSYEEQIRRITEAVITCDISY